MTAQHIICIGLSVKTADGAELGWVKEVAQESFDVGARRALKVDAPWRRDYWLDAEDIGSVDDSEGVVMTFEKGELDRHKIKDASIEWIP